MPFVARDRDTQARVDITQYANPREALAQRTLICQICETRMILRQGFVIRPHFAHPPTRVCPVPYAAHPETIEHLQGKASMRAWLQAHEAFHGATIDLEVPIHARKRIADILATFPNGDRVAVEIQLAGIGIADLEARTKDYFDDGIDVIWVLGGAAAQNPGNFAWCRTKLGGYFQLAFTEDTRTVAVQLPCPDNGTGS